MTTITIEAHGQSQLDAIDAIRSAMAILSADICSGRPAAPHYSAGKEHGNAVLAITTTEETQ